MAGVLSWCGEFVHPISLDPQKMMNPTLIPRRVQPLLSILTLANIQ